MLNYHETMSNHESIAKKCVGVTLVLVLTTVFLVGAAVATISLSNSVRAFTIGPVLPGMFHSEHQNLLQFE